jgi:ubiquinone/menaquinone biosynthesis C-methylase UbiE
MVAAMPLGDRLRVSQGRFEEVKAMTQEHSIPVFDWFSNQFTVDARSDFIEQVGPVLVSLMQPGHHVLDLCCGAGAISFFLEDQGARVTGLDLAPGLISIAQEEAARRGSQITFIQGDALTYPLGEGEYDLIVCFGNAVLDFPHDQISQFRDRVHRALTPEGHFVLEYRDGVMRVLAMSEPREVIEDGADGQIKRRFREYDPERGVYTSEYDHLATGEHYEATGYIYTAPLLRVIMETRFDLDRSLRLGESSFMDIYLRP